MSTTIRPELSNKNKYWIERHRYYELKHFCLQYPLWRKELSALTVLTSHSVTSMGDGLMSEVRPTENTAERILYLKDRINMVEWTSKQTSTQFGRYILEAVTKDVSYEKLNAKYELECSKDTYYELYRRFFWLLDDERR